MGAGLLTNKGDRHMTQSTTRTNNQPTHTVYAVIEPQVDGAEANWVPITGAWRHKDGEGLAFPLGKLRIVIRPRKTKVDMADTEEVIL